MPDHLRAPIATADARSERLREGERRAGREAATRFAGGVAVMLVLLVGSVALSLWCGLAVKDGLMLFAVLFIPYLGARGVLRHRASVRRQIEHRRRWRRPIAWPRGVARDAPTVVRRAEEARIRRSRGPLGGRWASSMPLQTALLVVIVLAVMLTAWSVLAYR